MRRVRRQAQRVNSFPGSNADIRRIEVGALLGQLQAPLFAALEFFVSEAFGRSLYQVTGAGRRLCQAGSSVAARAASVAPTGSLAILGLVDLESAALKFLAVQRLHCARRIRIGHFHKAKTAWTPRIAIGDQGDLFDGSMRRKQRAHALFSCREGKVSNVKFGHCGVLTGEY